MSAASLNLTIEQYATFSRQFTLTQDNTGEPRNLTGFSIKAVFKRNDATTHTFTIGTGFTLSNPTAGEFSWVIPAATTALMTGIYRYDLIITSGSGVVERLLEGEIRMSAGVTPNG